LQRLVAKMLFLIMGNELQAGGPLCFVLWVGHGSRSFIPGCVPGCFSCGKPFGRQWENLHPVGNKLFEILIFYDQHQRKRP
jgi:hypothetical protein